MDDEQYINIEDGLSVGAVKYVDPNEMITEEDFDYIKNKIPELDGRVGVIEDEIDEINSSLDNIAIITNHDLQNYINSFNNDGKLHIKSGLYNLENKLLLKSNMILSGKFNKSVLKISESANASSSLLFGDNLENVIIENLVFDGFGSNRDSNLYYHGGTEGSNQDMKIVDVEFKNCRNLTIKNCIFNEAIYGSIRLTNCENVNFIDNYILSSYGHGLIIDKSENCIITGNRIFNCGKDSRYPAGLNGCGIAFIDQTSLNSSSHSNIVEGNILINCREAGISYEGHRRIIANNILINCGKEKAAIKSMSHSIDGVDNNSNFREKQHSIHGNMIIGSLNATDKTGTAIHAVGSDIKIDNNFIYARSNKDYVSAKGSVNDNHAIFVQIIHDGGVVNSGDTRNVFVTNNYVKNYCARGVYVTGNGSLSVANTEIKDNKIINCVLSGIVSASTNGLTVVDNLVQNCSTNITTTDDRPILITSERRRLILNNNKVIFDAVEIPFENFIKTATDGNIEISYCTPKMCQINGNIITGNYSNAIRLGNSVIDDLQINLNIIKPHDTQIAASACSGIILHEGTTIKRLNCCNNNINKCTNRSIYLREVESGVICGNIADESTGLVYMAKNVKKCIISSNVGGSIGMAGSSSNENNIITNNIVSNFGYIDTSANKVFNNNIEYM